MADSSDASVDAPPSLASALSGALAGIIGRGRVVITPYPFAVGDADYLRVVSVNSVSGVSIEVHGRLAIPGAEASPFRFPHTPTSDRVKKSEDFKLGGGIVTNLTVFASAGAPLIGQTFVIVQLMRDRGGIAFAMGTLLAGYITATQPLGWPGSPISNSLEAEPAIRTINGTVPAPGAEIHETVPNGARWELISLRYDFLSSAAPGNRSLDLKIEAPFFQPARLINGASVGPTQNAMVTWAQNLPLAFRGGTNIAMGPLPSPLIMLAGYSFTTVTGAFDFNDFYSGPCYTVREWLDL